MYRTVMYGTVCIKNKKKNNFKIELQKVAENMPFYILIKLTKITIPLKSIFDTFLGVSNLKVKWWKFI